MFIINVFQLEKQYIIFFKSFSIENMGSLLSYIHVYVLVSQYKYSVTKYIHKFKVLLNTKDTMKELNTMSKSTCWNWMYEISLFNKQEYLSLCLQALLKCSYFGPLGFIRQAIY